MKQEEEEVDVDGLVDDELKRDIQAVRWNGDDEDIQWAEEEPDDDVRDWTMKIIMEDDADIM